MWALDWGPKLVGCVITGAVMHHDSQRKKNHSCVRGRSGSGLEGDAGLHI